MHNLVLDSKGEYLYGIGPGNRLQQISMKEANQANDSFGGVIINRNVDKFALSPDGTKLAYVKQDRVYFGDIATAEWEAHAETFFNAQQTISNLYITAENHFFFDWSRRIYSWNWGQMQYTVRYIYTANGMLYYRGDAAFYMIQQDGMSLKLCDIVG